MQASTVSLIFGIAVLLQLALKLWLSSRQTRHVALHRGAVPQGFADRIELAAHQKAADYTVAKLRFGVLTTALGTVVLLGWTLLGGLDQLNRALLNSPLSAWGPMAYQLGLLGAFAVISGLIDFPVSVWRTFRLEQAFGFNRMTWSLFLADSLKASVVGAVVGLPIAALMLWLMGSAGALWWLAAWGVWMGFNLLMLVLFPTVIAPLFNKFQPLDDASLRQRVEGLMSRCGFQSKGLFVMDGSRRSAHANAYFTGFGAAKRVVFFDTLLNKLSSEEVEAVLAHELGHFKHKHVLKRIVGMFALSFLGFALLGWLSSQAWFYQGLGVQPSLDAPNHALALLLFMLAGPVFSAFVSPVFASLSRRHEFEADTYACRQADGQHLIAALIKLYQDNASTLTPDPLYVRFYYSHPPATERIEAMRRQLADHSLAGSPAQLA